MRTFLVAMVAETPDELLRCLVDSEGTLLDNGIDAWWVAEDDRPDESDTSYDSAIFVPRGGQKTFANVRDVFLQVAAPAYDRDGYPFEDTSGQWYVPPEQREARS